MCWNSTPPTTSESEGGSSEAGGACVDCGCKPISSIKLLRIAFKSDHDLLKDYDADWKDGGVRFPKPEWTPAAQHPVSHTMDLKVELELTFEVLPKDACTETGDLRGEAPDSLVFEKKGITFSAGEVKVTVKSDKPLVKKIQELSFKVDWTVSGTSAGVTPSSTTNKLFVTMGTPTTPPAQPGITLKRMRHAVKATGGAGSLDPHKIVEHVMSKWSSFNLNQVYDNAWELADDARDGAGDLIGADCQTIVRHTDDVIKMVGCPGKAEFIVVWARVPTPTKGEENLAYTPNMSSPKQWHNSNRPANPARAHWRATLEDHGGGLNRYEACLRFTYPAASADLADRKYYAGGVGKLSNANQVIKVFKTMSWLNEDAGALAGVIHTY
jgi:hypothetical protein